MLATQRKMRSREDDNNKNCSVRSKFLGGGRGGGWGGGSSEGCLKWGGGGWGVIKGSFQ